MAVAHVATGSHVYEGSGTTFAITSPAGAIGDLLIFGVTHDDYSDGPMDDAPTGGVTLTNFAAKSGAGADDLAFIAWWGIEDQTAGRAYTFGTLSTSEQLLGTCVRYSGAHATTPIQSGSVIGPRPHNDIVSPLSASTFGGMFYNQVVSDNSVMASGLSRTVPDGWTSRYIASGSGVMMTNVCDRPVDRYPMPMAFEDHLWDYADSGTNYSTSTTTGFVIAPAETSRTISGVTKDNDGSVAVSVVVSLFKDKGSGVYQYVDTVTSHSGTGAYSFTLINDSDAKFMAVGQKADSPHIFDCSDNVLVPS